MNTIVIFERDERQELRAWNIIKWNGPGLYADAQFGTMFDGAPRIVAYPLTETDTQRASKEAHSKGLGTPRCVNTPEGYDVVE